MGLEARHNAVTRQLCEVMAQRHVWCGGQVSGVGMLQLAAFSNLDGFRNPLMWGSRSP
jgi:hypothetical protein